MRPGMFDNVHTDLRRAFVETMSELERHHSATNIPQVSLGSEHFFDISVVEEIHAGRGLPYRRDESVQLDGQRELGTILVEFLDLSPISIIEIQLHRLQTAGYIPVVAHPERYRAVWADPGLVDRLQRAGCVALLDSAALVGKYGRRAQECAEALLEDGTFHAACSDAHRPEDVEPVSQAMELILERYGQDELNLLFRDGPTNILNGHRPSSM